MAYHNLLLMSSAQLSSLPSHRRRRRFLPTSPRRLLPSLLLHLPLLLLLMISMAKSATIPQQRQQEKQTQQQQQKYTFRDNCADEHDKEFISCMVTIVDCNIDLDKLIPSPPARPNSDYPNEAHDVRIEPFAKAMSTRGTGEDGNSHHQLLVDISWQTPPNNSTHALKAFLLEIEGEGGRKHACFLLNLTGTEWTPEKVAQSPRLHFSSNSLFSFSQSYEVELYSLPEKSAGSGASTHTRFTTPHNPNGNSLISADLVSANCSKQSNQFASKWTAGFRHIYVHSAARIMQVEFVGAPPQYCFESYEVRLLDETGLELLYSGTVLVEDMHRNGNMIVGQYNFSDLEYDRSYIPSVIPVERALDGRCLCPVFGIDPYDVKVVCSCVAADWRPVRMTRPDVVKLCPDCSGNQSVGVFLPPVDYNNASDHNKAGIMWPLLVVFNALFLLLLCIFIVGYMRCRNNGTLPRKAQFQPIRFVPPARKKEEQQLQKPNGFHHHNHSNLASSLAIRTNIGLGTVSTTSLLNTPLISAEERDETASVRSLNLLIVYAHDNEAHERAVISLAEYLRDIFHINISLDRWDSDKIESNLIDWLSASVVEADKIMVINSAGAWERYHAKISSGGLVKKIDSDPLDYIFIAHIDMALQHHSIVSTRFNYTKQEQTLPMLNGLLQYIIPDNMSPLVSAIFGRNMRLDERLTSRELAQCTQMAKLRESIDEMAKLAVEEPNWLAKTHHRLRRFGGSSEETQSAEMEATEAKAEAAAANGLEEDAQSETASMTKLETSRKTLHVDMPLSLLLEKQQQQENSGKLDSGIFDWNISDEENGGTLMRSRGESAIVNSDMDMVYCNGGEIGEVAETCIESGKVICHEKITAKIGGGSSRPNDESTPMDSGLVTDEAPEMAEQEHSPMLAAGV